MISGAQIRMARAAAKLGLRALAAEARVSPNTITRVEADGAEGSSNASTVAALQRALEARGVEFLPNNGVRLKTTTDAPSGGGEPGESDKPAGSVAPAPKKPVAPSRKAE